MVRTALIGTGGMGRKYIRHINEGRVPHMCLAAAVARRKEAQEELRALCGDLVRIFASEEELYEHADLFDAVMIATPHMLHPQMTENALRHGKHVLCDKPLGVSVYDCRKVIELAGESDLVFSVMFHQRVWRKHMRIHQLIEEGTLGSISRILLENSRYFRTEYYHRSGSWRSSWNGEGGGMLINQGQHILDLWQWLFGMPESITADIRFGKYNDFTVDDEATIQMRYENGTTGTFILSTGEGTAMERIEVIGTKGTAVLHNDQLTLALYDQDLNDYRRNEQVNAREHLHTSVTEENLSASEETHPLIMENFALAIETGQPLIVEGTDAVNALALTNAAYLSGWTGKKIHLPFDALAYRNMLEEQQENETKTA